MKIKTGIIGVGTMGQGHLKTLLNDVPACEVVAVCDPDVKRLSEAKEKGLLSKNIRQFSSYAELLDSGICNAVIVVTPHPLHPEISICAFKKGIHVLCDKPIAVTVSGAEKMIRAWKKSKVKFSTMYSMRTTAVNRVIKDWLSKGKLGAVNRADMVCTKWLRSQKYYDEQTWRGTWKGEGAGLLLNQAPHNLDLLYWWFGPAASVSAKVSRRFHNIETEDEVEARIYARAGFPIRFYSSTGEAPGIDRIEIVGTRGTLVKDGSALVFHELGDKSDSVIKESPKGMVEIPSVTRKVEVPQTERGHKVVFRDFFDAIVSGRANASMIAPGDEGIHSLEWANAMLMSSVEGRQISLPLDRRKYDKLLGNLINGSTLI